LHFSDRTTPFEPMKSIPMIMNGVWQGNLRHDDLCIIQAFWGTIMNLVLELESYSVFAQVCMAKSGAPIICTTLASGGHQRMTSQGLARVNCLTLSIYKGTVRSQTNDT